jgi:competence/damage-inducible protein CinA-like protein
MTAKCDAEILTIGDELNRGEIVDTNSSWLAERLTELGLHVRWRTSVTDDPVDMRAALDQAAARARVVVASGGLGPTEDDRTVDVVSDWLGVDPAADAAHEAVMRARFGERNFRVTPNNLRQVRVPAGAVVLRNRKGLAPGFRVERAGMRAELYFMPGVPREMKPMFDDEAAPRIRRVSGGSVRTLKRAWRVAGMGESHVDHALAGLLDGIGDSTLHFRIDFPENVVTVVLRGHDEVALATTLEALDADVRARLGDHIYDGDSLAAAVGARLRAAGATFGVAESCTGGMVGQLLTAVPGSSEYFRGGVVAYADDVKTALLGVRAETLAAHGAVSAETALEMAQGARRALGTTWGGAITGVAGPDGGTPEKPVGTVDIALVGPALVEHRRITWPPAPGSKNDRDGREQVRRIAAFALLHLLYKSLAR